MLHTDESHTKKNILFTYQCCPLCNDTENLFFIYVKKFISEETIKQSTAVYD